MSSEHIIIVARNTETCEVRLPLGGTTLYEVGDESILEICRLAYGPEWGLSLYKPIGDSLCGTKPGPEHEDTPY